MQNTSKSRIIFLNYIEIFPEKYTWQNYHRGCCWIQKRSFHYCEIEPDKDASYIDFIVSSDLL